jgi:hypothetical protein
MYTSAELQLLRNADPGVQIPGIDTPVGNLPSSSSLKTLSSISTSSSPPVFYNAERNTVYVVKAGTVLSGYNFSAATVVVGANDVTIKDCTFAETAGYYAVTVNTGYGDTTVTDDTFTSNAKDLPLVAWVATSGTVTVTDNKFLDTPADGLHCFGGGTISGNYFSGVGYTSDGQHPDAIWVTNSTAPLSITDNFIDWTTNSTSNYSANDCIRITTEQGSVANVTVSNNYLIGGGTGIDAGNSVSPKGATYNNISLTDNYIGFATYNDFCPGPMNGVTTSGNFILDYTSPAYAANAWAAYQAAGLSTPNLLVSNGGATEKATSSTPTTLYGSNRAHLYGGGAENVLVAGYGTEYINGGAGANLFTYLAPNGLTTQCGSSPSYISNFDPAKDVIDLSHIDADLTKAGLQSFTFIGTNAFTGAGAEVRYQENPATGTTTVQATLAGGTLPELTMQISGLVTLTAANFALTPAQSASALANGDALSDPSARSGSATEYNYTNVKGRSYSSYAAIAYANNVAADDLYLCPSANQFNLIENGATITRGAGVEDFSIGNGSFNVPYLHAYETINAGGGDETVKLSQGFRNETINGFNASGAKADTLELSKSAFSYLNDGMTQTQDLEALMAHATSGSGSMTIADSYGDKLTLGGVTAATLTANPGAVKFF